MPLPYPAVSTSGVELRRWGLLLLLTERAFPAVSFGQCPLDGLYSTWAPEATRQNKPVLSGKALLPSAPLALPLFFGPPLGLVFQGFLACSALLALVALSAGWPAFTFATAGWILVWVLSFQLCQLLHSTSSGIP